MSGTDSQASKRCVNFSFNLTELPKQVLLIGVTGNEEDKRGNIEEVEGYDPFDDMQEDPAQSHALDSSLWELTALQTHNSPVISKLAKIFEGSFTKQHATVSDFLDECYQSVSINHC